MNQTVDEHLAEQLSALMDGELPEAQARFLHRRLEHDADLRALWARLHVASSCIRNQPWQPSRQAFDGIVPEQVASAYAPPPAAQSGRRQLRPWAIAASIAALALLFAPRLLHAPTPALTAPVAISTTAADEPVLASPGLADLVAPRPASRIATSKVRSQAGSPASAVLRPAAPDISVAASPLPLSAQSPADFPLADNGDKRSWPRSQLPGGRDDPSLEAYLVRHNQMLAGEGLGGFVPYVDVVASDASAPPAMDIETDQQ